MLPVILGVQLLGEIHLDHLVHKGWRGVKRSEIGIFAGTVAGLLIELTLCRIQPILRLGIQLARRDLKQDARVRIAELPLHKHTAVREQREYADRADMADDLADRLVPVRQANGVAVASRSRSPR